MRNIVFVVIVAALLTGCSQSQMALTSGVLAGAAIGVAGASLANNNRPYYGGPYGGNVYYIPPSYHDNYYYRGY